MTGTAASLPDGPAALRVVGAAILQDGKLLLVSKRIAAEVFYLPGGKPEPGEEALETLGRELGEELGVTVVAAVPFRTICAPAALEDVPMEMAVFLTEIVGRLGVRAEIASVAWVGSRPDAALIVAPAVRDHLIPALVEAELLR